MIIRTDGAEEIEERNGEIVWLVNVYVYNPKSREPETYKQLTEALLSNEIPQYGKPETWPFPELPLCRKKARPLDRESRLIRVECQFAKDINDCRLND